MEIAQELKNVKASKLILFAVCTYCIAVGLLATVERSQVWGKEAARALGLKVVSYTLGGFDVVVDHKLGAVENAAKLSRDVLERNLYFALLQLQAQGETLNDLQDRIELDSNTGAKVIKWDRAN